MSVAPFNFFQPEPNELLERISHRVDDSMLEEIAAADYGREVKDNLSHLRRIRDQRSFAIPMRWDPREVLELIRWSQPEDPNWKPGAYGERGHWMRAFACASLLRAAGESENSDLRSGWNQTLIQLVDSLRFLGPHFDEPAAKFLAWLIQRYEAHEDGDELAFFAIGLLWFGLNLRSSAPDEIIISLCEWIAARERRDARDYGESGGRWLLSTTCYDLRHAAWESLGGALETIDAGRLSPASREWVRLIGSALSGSQATQTTATMA